MTHIRTTHHHHQQTKQNSKIKFPLPHRIQRPPTKALRGIYKANRPTTYFK